MAFELSVERELCVVGRGRAAPGDREESLRLLGEAFALAHQIEACSVVIDLLDLEFIPGSADASVFSERLAGFGRDGMRASIVAPAGAAFGVARTVSSLAELTGSSASVFGNCEDARCRARVTSSVPRQQQ